MEAADDVPRRIVNHHVDVEQPSTFAQAVQLSDLLDAVTAALDGGR